MATTAMTSAGMMTPRPQRVGLRAATVLLCLLVAPGLSPGRAAEDDQRPAAPQELPGDEDDPLPLKRKATPPDKKPADPPKEQAPSPEKDADPAAKKPDPSEPPAKPDGLDHLDPNREKNDYLSDAIRGMRDAQLKMETKEAGKETPVIQQKVIDDLEKLIAEIQQQNSSSSSSSQSSSRAMKNVRSPRQSRQAAGKQSQAEAEQKQQQAQQNTGAGGKSQNQEGDSTDDRSERERAQQEEERRRRLSQDVWGHLPPQIREKLLNTYTERFLPKYEDVVRKYYEALAQKRKSGPSR